MLKSVWLTGWLLLVYTEGKLDWEVAEKITDYGQNLTLFCEVDKCCTEQSGWLKENLAIYLDIRIIADDPKRKYGTFVRANGFGLVIRKLNTNDINITYSCSYGFEISDPKLLQFDDVFIELFTEGPTTSLILTTTEEQTTTDVTAEHTTSDITAEEGKSHVGEIIGSIVGGVIGVVVIIVIAVVFLYRRRSTNRTKGNAGCEDEMLPLQQYPKELLDHKEVRLKVEEMETKLSEVIPVHIQDQKQKHLELWQKKDQMFVSTGATEHVLKCITENSCVTVTGNSGVGKTFIVRHVALILKGEGYTVVPTCLPKDIRDFTKPGSKTLYVVDDIGGLYTLNQKYLDDWKLMLPDITLLLENNDCKIIATCRLQVFKDEKFKSLSVFTTNECNLNSEELCLTADEKSSLAKKYFGDQASKVLQLSDQYEFFPLLCSLYDKDKFSDLSLFFSKPFDCYKQELDHLLNEGDEGRYKYCVLALVVMFNNQLSEDHLSDDYSKIIENTLDKCKLNSGTSVECLKDALHTLEGTFVVKDEDCYKTVHDKLFDFLAKYFGDKMLKCIIDHGTSEFINERIVWKTPDNTETDIDFTIHLPDNCLDMYIKRLVDDWSDGKVLRLFCSKNLKTPTFIVKLLDHIKQHDKSFQVKLANVTVDNNNHDTTLLQSCFVGDVNLTQWILDNTVYNNKQSQGSHSDSIVNKCRDDGTSPVDIACYNGHLSVLDRLIECKADINKCCNDGASPVYIACQNGHLSILDRLIECKADINKCCNDGASPVYIACQNGHLSVLDRLIECKADINKCRDTGASPVYIACEYGHLSVLDRLIECKADINKCDDNGGTPVYIACYKGHLSVLDRLIECKADINKCSNNGVSPVYIACQNGHVNILNTLLESKADINKCTKDGYSPLHVACNNNHIDVLLVLLKLYKKNKVMIDLCDDWGSTPLYWACKNGFVQIVTTLLQHGANPHQCNNVGKSPLQVADDNGHVDVVTAIKEFIPITV